MNEEYSKWLKTLSRNFKINYKDYGGFYQLDDQTTLTATTDGVGSKLLLAEEFNCFNYIGQDLVAMVVNDCITSGAKPLFLTNYISVPKIDIVVLNTILKTIHSSCGENKLILIGGETAEHDYSKHYDLSATCIGLIDHKSNSLKKKEVQIGDKIIGLQSAGFHANGYSLLRKTMLKDRKSLTDNDIDIIMKPTKIYCNELSKFSNSEMITAMAHITGGGLFNIGRVLSQSTTALLYRDKIKLPNIFKKLKKLYISDNKILEKNFNMGIGFVVVANEDFVSLNQLQDYVIGEIVERSDKSLKIIGEYGI